MTSDFAPEIPPKKPQLRECASLGLLSRSVKRCSLLVFSLIIIPFKVLSNAVGWAIGMVSGLGATENARVENVAPEYMAGKRESNSLGSLNVIFFLSPYT